MGAEFVFAVAFNVFVPPILDGRFVGGKQSLRRICVVVTFLVGVKFHFGIPLGVGSASVLQFHIAEVVEIHVVIFQFNQDAVAGSGVHNPVLERIFDVHIATCRQKFRRKHNAVAKFAVAVGSEQQTDILVFVYQGSFFYRKRFL